MKLAYLILSLLLPSMSQASGNPTAIRCKSPKDPPEIYVINGSGQSFSYFNQKTRTIEPVCFGNCRWSSTPSKISFETDSGFTVASTLNRVDGTMVERSAFDQVRKSNCQRIPMPSRARNRF